MKNFKEFVAEDFKHPVGSNVLHNDDEDEASHEVTVIAHNPELGKGKWYTVRRRGTDGTRHSDTWKVPEKELSKDD